MFTRVESYFSLARKFGTIVFFFGINEFTETCWYSEPVELKQMHVLFSCSSLMQMLLLTNKCAKKIIMTIAFEKFS